MKQIEIKKDPVFFYNSDFQTIQIKVTFPFKTEKINHAFTQILPNMLHLVSKKYPTEREFFLETQKEYILAAVCTFSTFGELNYFTFHFSIPDVPSLNQDLLEEQFQFFHQMMYEPKVENGAFGTEELQREIRNLRIRIDKNLKDYDSYASIKVCQIIDPESTLGDTIYNHMEHIDQVNEKNLYDFYLETIYHNQPMIHVFGNVDQKRINELCHKYLFREDFHNKKIEFRYLQPVRTKEEPTVLSEDSKFRNSIYTIIYNVQDMKDEDRILLDTLKSLLTSQATRLLYKKLRDENDLVYSAYAFRYEQYGVFGITAFIHKEMLEKVKVEIQNVLKELDDEELIKDCLLQLQERFRIGMIRKLDDKGALFQEKILNELGVDYSSEEYYQKLCSITSKDISLFAKRLILNTEYFLKEGEHE